MSMIVSGGIRIFFKLEGERGPFLFLHHGLFGSHRDWYEWGFVKGLAREFRLVIPDARGHGRSDKPLSPAGYSLSAFASDIIELLNALEIRNVHFLGYSLGALAGFELLTRYPGRVRGAALGGEAPLVTKEGAEFWADLATKLQGGSLGDAVHSLNERNVLACSGTDFSEDSINEAAPVLLQAMQQWDLHEQNNIRVRPPLTLFSGADDSAAQRIENARRRISHARLISIPGTTTAEAVREGGQLLKELLNVFRSPQRGERREAAGSGQGKADQEMNEITAAAEEEGREQVDQSPDTGAAESGEEHREEAEHSDGEEEDKKTMAEAQSAAREEHPLPGNENGASDFDPPDAEPGTSAEAASDGEATDADLAGDRVSAQSVQNDNEHEDGESSELEPDLEQENREAESRNEE
ncbi:MAG: alpha/beta fold hydrolase [SAR324 cluster bacterium]|nr:alpha/beta fold hydrolase [SAR324 cluster bacterium]